MTESGPFAEHLATVAAYLWERLPLVLLFGGGYLASRLAAATGVAEALALRALSARRTSPLRIILGLTGLSALISCFLPNALAVLTLLPAAKILRDDLTALGLPPKRTTTAVTLALMYGANIGGMGSLIGSPANIVLVGALDFLAVPGREQVTFVSWMLWSLPLVAGLAAAGGVLAWLALPRCCGEPRAGAMQTDLPPPAGLTRAQMAGLALFAAFLLFWVLEGLAVRLFHLPQSAEAWAGIAFTLAFVYAACVHRFEGAGVLLPWRNVAGGLPRRGLVALALAAGLVVLLDRLGLDRHALAFLDRALTPGLSAAAVTAIISLTVILASEVVSNTLAATAFFAVAHSVALANGFPPLPAMIAVSAASTCAFMTPLATPANTLAYGEMKGTSLLWMFALGLVLDLVCALGLALWLPVAVPLVYKGG